jgi:bifunctional DNA-binding transcriptional regulator/antitoxin component of YhaV-PrlF toxin-antitoxin module
VPRFKAELSESGRGGGRWIEVPFDAREAFGEARAPVAGTVNGVEFRARLSVYDGKTYLGLRKEIRDAAGIDVGDPVEAVLERDDAPRDVEVPPALAEALQGDAAAREAFDTLSFTHRKEYARWIADAKRDETRERRVAKALEMLRAGTKTPDA